MNFVKKNFFFFMNLISVLFVIISIGSITSYGLSEGRNTFYKTISFSSKPFNLTNGDKVSYLLLNVLFFTGLILLVVSAVNYCKNNKIKGIILIITDVIFFSYFICIIPKWKLFINDWICNYNIYVTIFVTI